MGGGQVDDHTGCQSEGAPTGDAQLGRGTGQSHEWLFCGGAGMGEG